MNKIKFVFVALFLGCALLYSSCTPEEDIQLSLDKTSVTLNVGETSQLKANISHVSDSKKGGPVLIWESSNTKVATVSNGMVTAVAPGEATISVRSGDSVANCSVTVQISVTSVALNASSLILIEGESSQLSASVHPSNAVNKELTWSSSNTSVAVVSSSGVVTAKIPGTATIKASTKVGNITATCEVIVKGVIVEVPDATFKSYLLSNFDTDGDGEIRREEAEKIYKIDVDKMAISSLKGIEQMPNLSTLYCSSNQLTQLDVSKNTVLKTLYCYSNQLTQLDVSKNTALTQLDCSSNQLTQLDVSKNTALTKLDCSSNQLTQLDVSKNTALTQLVCSSNQLTQLDVSKNTVLKTLYCYSNQLTELDVSNNTKLNDLYCGDNQLTHLDVSKNTSLISLSCYSNQLTQLDVSKNTALTTLYCVSNQLTQLDVSKNTVLKTLYCYSNQLTQLDVSKNTVLKALYCYSNQLTQLDVSKNTALTILWCSSNQLTQLDVSKNTALTELRCYSNQLTQLDISKNTSLTYLDCSPMNDSSGKNLLEVLYIASGQMIDNITSNRSSGNIPIKTEIRVKTN